MSFELLSRLPPQSFELQYREYRPDIEPAGGRYGADADSRVTFHLRGAPNEVILNTNCYLAGETQCTVDYSATPFVAITAPEAVDEALFENIDTAPRWVNGTWYSRSSRESFNSGALPYLDNQDTSLHRVHNALRGKMARRACDVDSGRIEDLESAGFGYNRAAGINVKYSDNNNAANIKYVHSGPAKWQCPLGMYSSLANSHSVLPVGLFSAYSVNGYSVEVTLPNVTRQAGNLEDVLVGVNNSTRPIGVQTGVVTSAGSQDGHRNVRIFVPIIKVLDPAVMEAILSLYEKREVVNVGGAAFPMSLRLNSLGIRHFQYPLTVNQGDYYIRIPSTDRSVRAIAWQVIRRTTPYNNVTDVSADYAQLNNLTLTRIQTRAGSHLIHEPVEDRQPEDGNISKFLAHNVRRSSSVLSPFPYYQEAIHHSDSQSDERYLKQWVKPVKGSWAYSTGANVPANASKGRANDCWGMVSFENLDHREPDYSGSFQASGIDLTNVGGLDVEMRFSRLGAVADTSAVAERFEPGPSDNNYVLVVQMIYDEILEASPSGVVSVTNAVL
jgi:hypothetical protein